MLYRKFGNTNIEASAIGMGTWNLGNQWGYLDEAESYATVQAALESGINMFDTADAYGIPGGLSEERLGRALTGCRHRVNIITKFGHWAKRFNGELHFTSPDIVIEAAHASLFRLRTDYLDVALCHVDDVKDPTVWLEGFEELKKRGLLRYYGISTDSIEVLKAFNRNNSCSVVEIDYSLINKSPEKDILPYCAENGIGVLVRGPLAMGLLSGRYNRNSIFTDSIRSSWNKGADREDFLKKMDRLDAIMAKLPDRNLPQTALKYIISHPAAPVAIPGAKSPGQAAANAEAGFGALTEAEYGALKSI